MSSEVLECCNGYCTRDAEVYVSVTRGRSPRVTVIAGERARDLLTSPLTVDGGWCVDCAMAALLEAVERTRPPEEGVTSLLIARPVE